MNLHERAVELVKEYQRVESELIAILRTIDDQRLYREHGATSLFVYATKVLGLSESVAWNFITVARATKKSPVLRKAIEDGALSVSKARRITSVLTLENQDEWVEKAQTLSQKELEREVARENPKAATPDRASYITGDFMKLEIGLTESELNEIRYVQDLVCQSKQSAVSIKDTILEAVRFYKSRKDPVEKAERARSNASVKAESDRKPVNEASSKSEPVLKPDSSQADGNTSAEPEQKSKTKQNMANQRRSFSAETLHELAKRDQNQCTAQNPDGSRCESRRWLDIHHFIHKSQGGSDTPENLVTLCRAHHRMRHATGDRTVDIARQS